MLSEPVALLGFSVVSSLGAYAVYLYLWEITPGAPEDEPELPVAGGPAALIILLSLLSTCLFVTFLVRVFS